MADNYLDRSIDEIEYFKVQMFRPNMDSIPSYPLPNGYSFELYKPNSGDDQTWAEIATAAGEFQSVQLARELFQKTFLADQNSHLLPERLFFLVNSSGRYIGQGMAWSRIFNGEEYGTIAWISIIPEYQGKKLAKPLVSRILNKTAEYSDKCCLSSQTTSWKAINMYADFGFKPYMKIENSEKAWKILSDVCKKPFLDQ